MTQQNDAAAGPPDGPRQDGRAGRLRQAVANRLRARPDSHPRPGPPDLPAVSPPRPPAPGMPRWLPKAFVLAAFVVAGFLLGWWLLGRLRDLLVILVLAQFLAFALEPAVNWLADRGWRRGAATGVVMFVVTVAFGGLIFAIGSLVVGEAINLAEKAPTYVESAVSWSNATFNTDFSNQEIQQKLTEKDGPLSRATDDLASSALGVGTGALTALFGFLTVALFAFYLCADGPRVRHTVCSMLPPIRQREVLRAWEIAIDKTGGYLYSRLLLAVASGLFHYAVLRALGVPYALVLAVWVGLVSQLIPTVGTYVAAALPLLITLVTDPGDALWLLAAIVIYQQLENYLLQPRITARTMNMHPAVAFGAVIAGAAVVGGVGALLAIPFVAIVQSFVSTYIRRYEVEEHPLTDLDPDEADGPGPEEHRPPQAPTTTA